VNLIRSTEQQLQFRLGRREKRLLLDLLKLYPCLPAARLPLSKSGGLPDPETGQGLLDEALAEQRQENRRQLQALLADPARFQEQETGWRLCLSPADLEWLLQILNDIRVGSWVLLGSPEERLAQLDEKTGPHYWAMEMSGHFQMQFLEAMQGPS
jgi:hypothetical protein